MLETREIEILPLFYDYILTKNYPVNILVGGRNSGKSFFMEQLAVINSHNNEKYKLLVIEDVETNIGAGVKDGIENRAEEFGYDSLFKGTKQPPEITHKVTGSSVIFKGYHSEQQQKQVKSLNEVTAAWYEEAENITYNQFKALRMQLRGGSNENRQLFLTLNPINADGFINTYFFDGQPDKVFKRFPDGRPKVFEKCINVELEEGETVSIPCIIVVSTHWDNPYLTAEQRADIEELKYTDEDQYAMLAEGKFVKGKGAYFYEFQRHIHVIDTTKPFIIPKDWRRYRVLDYGLDKLACYWIALDYQGKAYVYKELWESDLIVSQAAKRIIEFTLPDENIYQTIAPPDLWNRNRDTGDSTAKIFSDNGISLSEASNRVEQGCLDLKEWLAPFETRHEQTGEIYRTANMLITDNCKNLINSMMNIIKDEKNPNVYATQPHELTHSVDALRYFCAGRPYPPKIAAERPRETLLDKLGIKKDKVTIKEW
jgi:phage terminase large subunit